MTFSRDESQVLKIAREVLKQAESLVQYLEKKNLPEPNFTSNSPAHPADNEYDEIRVHLTDAAQDLVLLANGPMQWLRTFMMSAHDIGAWQTALRFKYFSIVPLDQPMSVKDMSAAAKMDADRLGRIMKLLATQRCFQEVEDDIYEHTSLSAFIAQNKDIEAVVAFQFDEMFEAASLTASSIEKNPYTVDVDHSAFTLRFGLPPFRWYVANPERGTRFALAMAGFAQMKRDTAELGDRFPWASLTNKTVVDVGGGSGHVAMHLATKFPDLKFIVQDAITEMLSEGPKRPEFKLVGDRVSFMQYDFFEPQPITDAGLFLLRQVAHNYPDDVCVEILKGFVPALEKCAPGTILLINDIVLPPANTEPKVEEHQLRQIDIAMMDGYAAKQRSLKEFGYLLKLADERFKIVNIHGKGVLGLIEVHLVQ
ncbi:hypothetical protein K445DRAFT_22184 [Daldinia sp. EC12]|nr:hypothetical protein K445DRAFT_22184 [Daldinia sp. EC12]